jgi:hypothetical protein
MGSLGSVDIGVADVPAPPLPAAGVLPALPAVAPPALLPAVLVAPAVACAVPLPAAGVPVLPAVAAEPALVAVWPALLVLPLAGPVIAPLFVPVLPTLGGVLGRAGLPPQAARLKNTLIERALFAGSHRLLTTRSHSMCASYAPERAGAINSHCRLSNPAGVDNNC